jgi:metal-sulfur cluster biosynthetic enzyme
MPQAIRPAIMTPPSLPDPETARAALRKVVDPEVGMNIVDLGLVYRIAAEDDALVVEMTMTSPACPMGDMILEDAEAALRPLLPDGMRLDLRLVWSPPWEPGMMSESAKRHFNWQGAA